MSKKDPIILYWDGSAKSLVECVRSALDESKVIQRLGNMMEPFHIVDTEAYRKATLALDELAKIAEAIDSASEDEEDEELSETIH
tara:strand:+ start:406 stop:660 length:255 start_codon:yes stop_codon:yes gene_type:complete